LPVSFRVATVPISDFAATFFPRVRDNIRDGISSHIPDTYSTTAGDFDASVQKMRLWVYIGNSFDKIAENLDLLARERYYDPS
jgi:hypothetical protein